MGGLFAGLLVVAGCQDLSLWAQVPGEGSGSGPEDPDSDGVTPGLGSTTGGAGSTGGDGYSPAFDLGEPNLKPDYDDPSVPPTCEVAAAEPSSMGCLFYAVDLDQALISEFEQYAVAIGNVQADVPATVTVETKEAGVWTVIDGPLTVDPLDSRVITLPDRHREGSGILEGGAYRVVTDVPVSAHQFSPLQGLITPSSGASLLMPVTAWPAASQVMGWVTDDEVTQAAYFTAVASQDATNAIIQPSVSYVPGPGVQPGPANAPQVVTLDAGDIVQVASAYMEGNEIGFGLSGSMISAGEENRMAVFSGHACASIPVGQEQCSHMQEMISPENFGLEFVAARYPVRDFDSPEPTLWQIMAAEDGTRVTFSGGPDITGLPPGAVNLDAGEVFQLYASGPTAAAGDFIIKADSPVGVAAYMVEYMDPQQNYVGGAAMVQLAPVDRFLPRYVLYVPDGWFNSYLTVTRRTGQTVFLDDVPLSDAAFTAVSPNHDVARVTVSSGAHVVSGIEPFGATVTGVGVADAYAYLAGSGRPVITIDPEG